MKEGDGLRPPLTDCWSTYILPFTPFDWLCFGRYGSFLWWRLLNCVWLNWEQVKWSSLYERVVATWTSANAIWYQYLIFWSGSNHTPFTHYIHSLKMHKYSNTTQTVQCPHLKWFFKLFSEILQRLLFVKIPYLLCLPWKWFIPQRQQVFEQALC